jgi:hypothetical protein
MRTLVRASVERGVSIIARAVFRNNAYKTPPHYL